jgi:hypothetical protein
VDLVVLAAVLLPVDVGAELELAQPASVLAPITVSAPCRKKSRLLSGESSTGDTLAAVCDADRFGEAMVRRQRRESGAGCSERDRVRLILE